MNSKQRFWLGSVILMGIGLIIADENQVKFTILLVLTMISFFKFVSEE